MTKRLVVTAEFDGNSWRQYEFLCSDVLGVKVGDKCVANTQNGDQIVKIVEIKGYVNDSNKFVGLAAINGAIATKATRWIIDKIDYTAHNARIEREAKFKELKRKMDARLKQLQTEQVFRMFAEQDDVLREMLSELDGLRQEDHEESR